MAEEMTLRELRKARKLTQASVAEDDPAPKPGQREGT